MQVETVQNALTFDDARAVMERAERLLNAGDVSGVMKTFTSDVIVRFADFPETTGRPPLEAFMRARFARQRNYRLQKQLRSVSGNVIVCSWDAEWEDGNDGRQMEGRGIEILTMQGNEVAKWETTFNVWGKGDAPALPIV
jgi:nuclear transport factor 2 (NTF2) superfamily protein